MKKENKAATAILFCAVALILTGLFLSAQRENKLQQQVRLIAVRCNPAESNSEALVIGFDEAARRTKLDSSTVTFTSEDTAEEQAAFLQGMVDQYKKQAMILVMPPESLYPYLREVSEKMPVIVIGAEFEGGKYLRCLCPDSYAMGRALAELPPDMEEKKILLLRSAEPGTEEQKCLQGVRDGLKARNAAFTETDRIGEPCDIILTLSSGKLTAVGKTAGGRSQVYGIGTGKEIAEQLAENRIAGTVICQEMALGFLSVMTADAMVRGVKEPELPPFAISEILADEIYRPENADLIFPYRN